MAYLYNEKWHDHQAQALEKYSNVIANNHEIKITTSLNNIYFYTRTVTDGIINPNIWSETKNSVPQQIPEQASELKQTIKNSAPALSDKFGFSVDVYADTMVVGSPEDGAIGQVHIFRKANDIWELEQELTPPVGVYHHEQFGYDVSIYEDTVVVGARFATDASSQTGAISIFKKTNDVWVLEQEIINPVQAYYTLFGSSVSIYRNSIVVGTPEDNQAGTKVGAMSIFTRDANNLWTLQQTVLNPDGTQGDGDFGHDVQIYDDTVVVSAKTDDASGSYQGTVYVYRLIDDVWDIEQELPNPHPKNYDYFGESVAIYGIGDESTIVVGSSYGENGATPNAGVVYVYTRTGSTWSLQQEINNPQQTASAWFGHSVDIYDNVIIVGAPQHTPTGEPADSGSGFLYIRTDGVWNLKQRHSIPSPSIDDNFGKSVAVFADELIINADMVDYTEINEGAVYAYNVGQAAPKTVIITQIDTLLRWFYQQKELPREVIIN